MGKRKTRGERKRKKHGGDAARGGIGGRGNERKEAGKRKLGRNCGGTGKAGEKVGGAGKGKRSARQGRECPAGKRDRRREQSGNLNGSAGKARREAGLGEESVRKRRRKSAGGKAGDVGPGGYGTGHEARKGNEGWSGGGNGVRGNGGRWSERKEAGRGERMRLGDVWGKERKKERILRLWRGKKANKSIVYKLVVFL